MTKREIYITDYDLRRLEPLIVAACRYQRADWYSLQLLQSELDRAIVCRRDKIPCDVVTVNSHVSLTDLDSGGKLEYTIVFPRDANYDKRRISVLAPIGTALLGFRAGTEVEWPTPGGQRRFRIDQVTAPVQLSIAA